MEYKELIERARRNELQNVNIGEALLAIDAENQKRDSRLKNIEKKTSQHDSKFVEIEEEYPLLPPEADDLSKYVQKKGVSVLGGKMSNAYQDKNLRKKVYTDIYHEIKRNFGLIKPDGREESYKKLKRKHLKSAFIIVDGYVAPIAIENEITDLNDLDDFECAEQMELFQ